MESFFMDLGHDQKSMETLAQGPSQGVRHPIPSSDESASEATSVYGKG